MIIPCQRGFILYFTFVQVWQSRWHEGGKWTGLWKIGSQTVLCSCPLPSAGIALFEFGRDKDGAHRWFCSVQGLWCHSIQQIWPTDEILSDQTKWEHYVWVFDSVVTSQTQVYVLKFNLVWNWIELSPLTI